MNFDPQESDYRTDKFALIQTAKSYSTAQYCASIRSIECGCVVTSHGLFRISDRRQTQGRYTLLATGSRAEIGQHILESTTPAIA